MRNAGIMVLAVVCAAPSARADKVETSEIPDADPADAKAARDVGSVLTDGKGHYIVFTGPDPDPAEGSNDVRKIFYGDGTSLFLVETGEFLWSAGVSAWSISDPRIGHESWRSSLRRTQGVYTMTCRTKETVTPLRPLAPADARKLLAKAAFKELRMDRRAFALGRDGTTYYYVDVARRSEVNTDFRAYAGKRGAMKRLRIKRIDTDTAGVVLTAKEGTLQITIEKKVTALRWGAKPSKQVDLSLVPTDKNLELIYSDLGVYAGKPFGVPCDDM